MSDYDDDERPRRENLMQRRLRKARGEEVDEDYDRYGYEDEDDRPRGMGGPSYIPPRSRGGGGSGNGCAQLVLALTLGMLGTLLIGVLLFNTALGGIGRLFSGVPSVPDIREIIITPTPQIITGAAVLQRVQQLSRLETASYSVQTVIEVNQSQGNPIFDFFAGDALLLIAQGRVVAGVDLGKLTPEQVTVAADGRTVTIQLPPAEVFDVTLDNQGTRVYSRNRGWFAPGNLNLETLARQQAERQILAAACEDGVLKTATDQAATALRQLLGLIDGIQVIVVPGTPATCEAP
ncbi:MAG: DUF4230 domain-containing protein [Oscillochloridaceae bacterium umkhey_bin13]